MRKLFKKLLPNRRVGFRVRGGILKGAKVFANPSAGENPYWTGSWEMPLQDYFSDLQEEGFKPSAFYDLGGHIGYFSMVVGRLFEGCETIVFEPSARNYSTIIKHRDYNPADCAGMTPLPFGIGEHCGNFTLLEGDTSFSNKISLDKDIKGKKVYCVSLDTAVYEMGFPAPDLIKMDIEGLEGPALRGARRVLAEFKPRIVIEVHGPDAAKEVDEVLVPLGAKIVSLEQKKEVQGTAEIARNHFSIVFE